MIDRDTARLRSRIATHVLVSLAVGFASAGCKTEPERPLPTCPTGRWCTDSSRAQSLATQQSVSVMGCSKDIHWDVPSDGAPPPTDLPTRFGVASLDEQATKKSQAAQKNACCYNWLQPCPGGRPLRSAEGEAAVLAVPRVGSDWMGAPGEPLAEASDAELSAESRRAIADAWLSDALAEHASVASFARAALELMAVGAPPELVAACQRASLDEVEHAALCFRLASRFAGRPLSPGPLVSPPLRAPTLEQIAVDTFEEGCVGETIAALAVERARALSSDVQTTQALERIADDEAEHAALAWTTLSWALRTGGDTVRRALIQAAQRLRPDIELVASGNVSSDSVFSHYGRLTEAAQERCQADAWREVIDPMLSELLAA